MTGEQKALMGDVRRLRHGRENGHCGGAADTSLSASADDMLMQVLQTMGLPFYVTSVDMINDTCVFLRSVGQTKVE